MPGQFDINELREGLAGVSLPDWTTPDQVPPVPGTPEWDASIRQRTAIADGSAAAPGPLGASQPTPPAETQAPQGGPNPFAPLTRFAGGFATPEAQERTQKVQAATPQIQQITAPYGSEQAIQQSERAVTDTTDAAIKAEGAATQAEANVEAAAASAKLRASEDHARRTQELMKERDKVVGDHLAQLDQLNQTIASTKIDPNRKWNDASTPRKIAGYIGLFLGGMTQVMSGHNPAAEIIDKELNRDLQAQQANLDNLKDAAAGKRTLLGLLREQYGDKQAALDAAKAHAWEEVAAQVEEQMARIKGNERMLADGLKMQTLAKEKALEHQQNAYTRAAAVKAEQWERDKFQQGMRLNWAQHGETVRHHKAEESRAELELKVRDKEAGVKAKGDLLKEERGKPFLYGAENIDPDEVGPDGQPYKGKAAIQRLTDTQRKEAAELLGSANNEQDLVADIKEVGFDRNVINDKGKAIATAAFARIRMARQAQVDGIPSDADQHLINATQGIKGPQDVLTWLSDDEKREVLETSLDMSLREVDTKLETMGLRRIPRGPRPVARDAKPVRERHPFEIRDTLNDKSRIAREAPQGAYGSFRGRSTEYGQTLMEIARSGKRDLGRAREAMNILRKEAIPYLSSAPMTETDHTIRAEIQEAIAEAQRNLEALEGREKLRTLYKDNPLGRHLFKD